MRTSHLTACVVLAFLAGCHDVNKVMGPHYTDQAIQWGSPVGNLQVGLAERNYEPGFEPEHAQRFYALWIKNVGRQGIKILWPAPPPFGVARLPLAGDESVVVTLSYQAEGKTYTAHFRPGVKPVVKELDPGEAVPFEFRLSPSRLGVQRFTAGQITASYSNQQAAIDYGEGNGGAVKGLWTGAMTSSPVKVDVAEVPK